MNFGLQYEIRRRTPSDIWEHLPFIYETVCSYQEPQVIELGTRTGNSTAALLAGVEKAGGHVWSVDVDKARVPAWWFASDLWTSIVASDLDVQWAAPVDADVLFIDTSHEYQHTLDELALYVPMVKPGGTVLLHDTEWESREVAKALDEFCPDHGLTWENRPGNNGLGVIRIP